MFNDWGVFSGVHEKADIDTRLPRQYAQELDELIQAETQHRSRKALMWWTKAGLAESEEFAKVTGEKVSVESKKDIFAIALNPT